MTDEIIHKNRPDLAPDAVEVAIFGVNEYASLQQERNHSLTHIISRCVLASPCVDSSLRSISNILEP